MKIGILTLPLYRNYGGILQAFALQTILENMGHEVVVFQRDLAPNVDIPLWRKPLSYGKKLVIKIIKDKREVIFWDKKYKLEYPTIHHHFIEFFSKNMHLYDVNRIEDIASLELDCIIVGGDQIWRPQCVKTAWDTSIDKMFLSFLEEKKSKIISFSASFGSERWEYSEQDTLKCKQAIKRFDAVSVREEDGVKFCLEYFDVKAHHVLDPVMLLTGEDYIRLLGIKVNKTNGNQLFSYILDRTKEKESLIQRVCEDKKLKHFYLNFNNIDKYAPLEERILPSVEEWVAGFCLADFVVTDSFHGCVLSILFGKPFIAVGNVSRGISRFTSLMKMFGTESNLISGIDQYDPSFSYELPKNINSVLQSQKYISESYLYRELSNT